MKPLQEKLFSPGTKRILSLDGGGIRGALTLGFLKKMEEDLQKTEGPGIRLGHYYDLIGGTSTGAIIATSLAIGMSVDDIKEQYFAMGKKIFGDKFSLFEIRNRIKAKYDSTNLEKALNNFFGETTFADPKILCGLCVVTKRADTNSTWPLSNFGTYFNKYTKDYKLKDVVRASAAAPSYFLPLQIKVTPLGEKAAFVDGGVSMSNNPTLDLLKIATLSGFGLNWEKGADKLLLTSIGTGAGVVKSLPQDISDNNLLNWAGSLPDMFMQDASWQIQTMMQWMGVCKNPWVIDREIGDLKSDFMGKEALFSYERYNVMLENRRQFLFDNGEEFEKRHLSTYGYDHLSEKQISKLQQMDNPDSVKMLYDIGYEAAKQQIA